MARGTALVVVKRKRAAGPWRTCQIFPRSRWKVSARLRSQNRDGAARRFFEPGPGPQSRRRVLVARDGTEIAACNTFPAGVRDLEERHVGDGRFVWMEHAERHVIFEAARRGVATAGACLTTTFFPCIDCARAIVDAGVACLDTPKPDFDDPVWGASFEAIASHPEGRRRRDPDCRGRRSFLRRRRWRMLTRSPSPRSHAAVAPGRAIRRSTSAMSAGRKRSGGPAQRRQGMIAPRLARMILRNARPKSRLLLVARERKIRVEYIVRPHRDRRRETPSPRQPSSRERQIRSSRVCAALELLGQEQPAVAGQDRNAARAPVARRAQGRDLGEAGPILVLEHHAIGQRLDDAQDDLGRNPHLRGERIILARRTSVGPRVSATCSRNTSEI